MRELTNTEINSVNGGGIWAEFKQAMEDILESILEQFTGEKPSGG